MNKEPKAKQFRDPKVNKGRQDLQVKRANKENKGRQDPKANRVNKENKGRQDLQDLQDLKDLKDPKANKGLRNLNANQMNQTNQTNPLRSIQRRRTGSCTGWTTEIVVRFGGPTSTDLKSKPSSPDWNIQKALTSTRAQVRSTGRNGGELDGPTSTDPKSKSSSPE